MRRISWSRILVIIALVFIALAVAFSRMGTDQGAHDGTEELYGYVGSEPVALSELTRSYEQRSPVQENISLEEYFEETYAPRTMLLLEAQELGLTVTDEEVDRWVMTINRSLESQNASFETYLDDLNLTYLELREDIRSSTLLDKVLEELVASQVMVSAEEIEEAYEAGNYTARDIPIEEARNEIGPVILREKQDERLREVVSELRERYDVRRI